MFCNKCGEEFEGKFCSNCGNLSGQEFEKPVSAIKKPKKTWLTIAVVVFAISVVFAMTGMKATTAIGSASFCGAITYLVFGIIKCIKKLPSKSMFIAMAVCVFLMIGSANAEVKPEEQPNQVSKPTTQPVLSSSVKESSSKIEQKSIIAGVGETLDYNGLKFTLDSVVEYKDQGKILMDEADAGNVFILLNFTASNETGKDEFINVFFEDSYCDDISIDPETLLFNAQGETIWGDIANGKKRKGYVAYQAPADWQNIEFYYKAEIFGGDSSKMMFKALASDLT